MNRQQSPCWHCPRRCPPRTGGLEGVALIHDRPQHWYEFGVRDLMAVVAVSAVAAAPVVECLREPGPESFALAIFLDMVALPGALSYWIEYRVKGPARRRELLQLVW